MPDPVLLRQVAVCCPSPTATLVSRCTLPLHAPATCCPARPPAHPHCTPPLHASSRQDERYVPATVLVAQGKPARMTVHPGRHRKQAFPEPLWGDIPHTGPSGSSWLQWPLPTSSTWLRLLDCLGKEGVAHSSSDPQKMLLENPRKPAHRGLPRADLASPPSLTTDLPTGPPWLLLP